MNSETIGQRLRKLRGKMTQEEFAKILHLHKNTIGNYERGERELEVGVIKALQDAFWLNANWLLTGQGKMIVDSFDDISTETDEELMGRIFDGILFSYKSEGAAISPLDAGKLAARMHKTLVTKFQTPESRLIALQGMLAQLRDDLRKPVSGTSSSKRSA